MDQEALRLLIRRKLRDVCLPNDGIKRVWTSRSNGETCDGLRRDPLERSDADGSGHDGPW